MDHPFYNKSLKEQHRIQLKIGAVAIVFNLFILFLSATSGIYFMVLMSIAITLSVIASFFDTPSLRKSGRLIYYSPLFLTEKEKKGVIILHGGTLFDYFFVIDRRLNGRQRTRFILKNYLEGMLALIESCENEPGTKFLKGTSYILNERTAKKLGFRVVKTDQIQLLILMYNYVNLTIASSLAKARLSFPRFSGIKTYEAQMSELIQRREYLATLLKKLEMQNDLLGVK